MISCVRLQGRHQVVNALVALRTIDALVAAHNDFVVSDSALERGIRKTRWPGRYEVFRKNGRKVILDGAHNPAALKALLSTLQQQKISKVVALFGVLRDKNFDAMIRLLAPKLKAVVLVPLSSDRSLSPEELAVCFPSSIPVFCSGSLREGWLKAQSIYKRDPLLVTGSLYLIGEVKGMI